MSALLNNSAEIWSTVKKAGGLDLRYHEDMDEDVIQSLIRALGLEPQTDLDSALRDLRVTVERFIGALLDALNPFSAMLSDLLTMFEKAEATHSDHALRIEFDFGNAPKLSFDLQQFRDWIETFENVRQVTRVQHWSDTDLWRLNSILSRDRGPDIPGFRPQRVEGKAWPHWPEVELYLPEAARPWVQTYESLRWPEFELRRPASGHAWVDSPLSKSYDAWSAVVRESSAFGNDRAAFHTRGFQANATSETAQTGWSLRFLAQVDSDRWAGSVAAGMHYVAEVARRLDDDNRAGNYVRMVVDELEELFSTLPSTTIEQEVVIRVLVDFLNLPVWKRRYELYSAWIMTLLADALSDQELLFHPRDGRLSFSFGGSHLATTMATVPQVFVWTELRSPLTQPSRLSTRKNIQPDYTLCTPPVTSAQSAVLVVECKQYRNFSKKNFSHAVLDYADGRPNAQIILAAYGPVRTEFLAEVAPDVARRITLIGGLRPGPTHQSEREMFRQTVRDAVDARAPSTPKRAIPAIPLARSQENSLSAVTLSWGLFPSDLDLHLAVRYDGAWARIDFLNSGTLNEFPWAELDADVTRGHGPETITIGRVLAAMYRCYVHNFSVESPLIASGAEVTVRNRDSEMRIGCPTTGAGRFWHVFDFNSDTQQVIVINAIVDLDPSSTVEIGQ